MPTLATYRCPKCGRTYRPPDAAVRHMRCCGVELELIAPTSRRPLDALLDCIDLILEPHPQTAGTSPRSTGPTTRVVEVIPPRENTIDALAVETMLQSLGTV